MVHTYAVAHAPRTRLAQNDVGLITVELIAVDLFPVELILVELNNVTPNRCRT